MSKHKQYDVLVVGELNMDLILNQIGQPPQPGKEILARQMTFTLGSSAAIFAANISVLGASVSFVGTTGTDVFADTILTALKTKSVDTRFIKKCDTGTGLSVALNYGNDRYMVTFPGAMETLSIHDITDEALTTASHLHISSIFLQKMLRPDIVALCRRAKAAGLTTSLDPQWDPEESWDLNLIELLPFVDVFMPNMEEFRRLTGEEQFSQGLEKLIGVANIIAIKDGVRGAVVWAHGELIEQPVFLNKNIVDCIGAGDSFNAGFISQFVAGKNIKACAEFGALAGAVNTTAAGGTGAFSSLESFKTTAQLTFNYTIDDAER